MKQAKKIFTRMCINNWGGITHKMLEFNEYVNLFSGKSGSGKSTVMDAIQVILYGSFSSNFLNKAADDAKNRRSVLGYLRGDQKDGTSNRENMDFCSHIVLELEDTGTHICTCIGIAFEVRSSDNDVKKFIYFSHSGKIPENEYLNAKGIPFTNKEISTLIHERALSLDNRGKGDVNRTYASKESYLNTLYDVIFGYIDGSRFVTMEKNAIALKMTNGTGQFIRDYMFPKNTEDTIEKISDQLGAYRDIKEKIDDLENRIGFLDKIHESNQALLRTRTDIIRTNAILKCIDIEELKNKIDNAQEEKKEICLSLEQMQTTKKAQKEQRKILNDTWIKVAADLKATDYSEKLERLSELERRLKMLETNSAQWRKIVRDLGAWENDETITDYVSNPVLHKIEDFQKGELSLVSCEDLKNSLEDVKQVIEEELEELNKDKREITEELKEKQLRIDDMKNNRKSYREIIRKGRSSLERRLSDLYGRSIKVYVFADLFDIQDEKWKNAIEGRLGKLKVSLITEPSYAQDGAKIFRTMKQFEEVEFINSKAIMDSNPQSMEHSLYEAVATEHPFMEACLKRYLGRIIKCDTVEDLEKVKDGVTADCYSYSNFIFRHLRKKDYTINACIGSKVSRTKLASYEEDAKNLSEQLRELTIQSDAMKMARGFESLNHDPKYLLEIAGAQTELEEALNEKQQLSQVIQNLKAGEIKELEEQERHLRLELAKLDQAIEESNSRESSMQERHGRVEKDIEDRKEDLRERLTGYVSNEEIETQVKENLQKKNKNAYRNAQYNFLEEARLREEQENDQLYQDRNHFIRVYPSCGFSGVEKSNESYDQLLADYRSNFEPSYRKEFDKQCDLIYKSLRDNVISSIHGAIKAANRHKNAINRLLAETNFSDSTYQIKIEPSKTETAQFYEMLMAEELDSKAADNDGFDGQMSFGQDSFMDKYEDKIQLLTEKFMPVSGGDDKQIAKKRQEMEYYADYRNYLSFSMYERVVDENGNVRENYVDDMAGKDSGGEGQNPKYVALLAGFAMLYMQQSNRDSRIKLVLLDEAFSKMDQERSEVCLKYARKLNLQLIVCVPDERLQSLIQNVDSVYGFRRFQNQISMMHIDKGAYLKLLDGR